MIVGGRLGFEIMAGGIGSIEIDPSEKAAR
jgi:hypothetical protein